MARWLTDQAGEAATEFMLVAPALLLILCTVLEMGRVLDAWVVVHNAAREGARAGTVVVPSVDPAAAAHDAAQRYLDTAVATRGDVASTLVEAPVITADSVAVTAQANVSLFTPLGRAIVAQTLPVRANALMRRQ